MFKQIVFNTLRTAVALTLTSTAAILLVSKRETGSPWSAINVITHIIDGDDVEQPEDFSARSSTFGLVTNATAMGAWAAIYEGALAVTKTPSSPIWGLLASAIAYVIDYKVVPKRYTPGIEKKLSQNAIYAMYGVLAATFAASVFWNKYQNSTESSES